MTTSTCPASYFDGKSATRNIVVLSIKHGNIIIHGDNINLVWSLNEVNISEPLGSAARSITHQQGGVCEIADLNSLENILNNAGIKKSLLDHVQHSYILALVTALILTLFIGLGGWFGLPIAAKKIAMSLPASSLNLLDHNTLETLDNYLLRPSQLNQTRQNEITSSFTQLVDNTEQNTPYNIVFRNSEEIGPNAFALPSGTIILLDQLVNLADDDNEIMAVLSHELGHVKNRHSVRMMLQASIAGLAITWWLGDVSTLLATVPGLILNAKYSRHMEVEADEYATVLLQKNNLSGCYLTTLLKKIDAHFARSHVVKNEAETSNNVQKKDAENMAENTNNDNNQYSITIGDFLSSHPPTQERVYATCPDSQT